MNCGFVSSSLDRHNSHAASFVALSHPILPRLFHNIPLFSLFFCSNYPMNLLITVSLNKKGKGGSDPFRSNLSPGLILSCLTSPLLVEASPCPLLVFQFKIRSSRHFSSNMPFPSHNPLPLLLICSYYSIISSLFIIFPKKGPSLFFCPQRKCKKVYRISKSDKFTATGGLSDAQLER